MLQAANFHHDQPRANGMCLSSGSGTTGLELGEKECLLMRGVRRINGQIYRFYGDSLGFPNPAWYMANLSLTMSVASTRQEPKVYPLSGPPNRTGMHHHILLIVNGKQRSSLAFRARAKTFPKGMAGGDSPWGSRGTILRLAICRQIAVKFKF